MTATKNLGRQEKHYYNTGTHASPSWSEMKRSFNWNLGFTKGEVNFQDGESDWEKTLGAAKKLGLSFTYREKKSATDTVFNALWDSFLNGTAIELAAMNGPIATTGSRGFRAFIEVMSMEKTAEQEGMTEWAVAVKLTEHEEGGSIVDPDRYVVP